MEQLLLPGIVLSNIREQIRSLSQTQREERKSRSETKAHKENLSWESYRQWFWSSDNRKQNNRNKLRSLHLAANFLRRTPYWKVETTTIEEPLLGPIIEALALAQGLRWHDIPDETRKEVKAWIQAKQ